MLDYAPLVTAVLAGALSAAAVILVAARMAPRRRRGGATWSWAVGAGVIVAGGLSYQWPHWPPLEDRARFLTLIVPLTLVIETLAAALHSRRSAWILRLALAVGVTPILLYDSVYLVAPEGRDSPEWSPWQAALIFAGLGILLTVQWTLLRRLSIRTSASLMHWVLALDSLATAATVMLSGYFGAGLVGLGLCGAIVGAAVAAKWGSEQTSARDTLGMSVIGIFSVVLMGRLFGALSTGLAAPLLLAPLLAWAGELVRLRTWDPRWQNAARLACVALPLLVTVAFAQQRFAAASAAKSAPGAPSADHR
jgi:hypothetical protein